ncbi:MAG: hypothetical protein ACREEQ_03960, partial [Caulobacteraceae bacterium]
MADGSTSTRIAASERAFLVWLLPAAIAAAASFAVAILNDGDTFWHLAAGRWMLAHRTVLSTDPFSYIFAGHPWTTQEWLSEVFMALAYRAAGWAGVMLLTGLAVGALAAAMSAWLLRWLSPLAALVALALGFGLVAPSLLARPHLLALPLLAIWTCGLLDARARRSAPAPALILLMALWANMHSSFIVALGLAAAFGLEAALDIKAWRRRTLLGWAAFVAASLIAALATPHGLSGLAFPLRVMDMKVLGVIDEWRPANFAHPSMLEGVLLAGLFLALWRGVRLSAVRTALI